MKKKKRKEIVVRRIEIKKRVFKWKVVWKRNKNYWNVKEEKNNTNILSIEKVINPSEEGRITDYYGCLLIFTRLIVPQKKKKKKNFTDFTPVDI